IVSPARRARDRPARHRARVWSASDGAGPLRAAPRLPFLSRERPPAGRNCKALGGASLQACHAGVLAGIRAQTGYAGIIARLSRRVLALPHAPVAEATLAPRPVSGRLPGAPAELFVGVLAQRRIGRAGHAARRHDHRESGGVRSARALLSRDPVPRRFAAAWR